MVVVVVVVLTPPSIKIMSTPVRAWSRADHTPRVRTLTGKEIELNVEGSDQVGDRSPSLSPTPRKQGVWWCRHEMWAVGD